LELSQGTGKPLVLKVAHAEARLPPLSQGRYQWRVRSLGEESRSDPSPSRSFELRAEPLKLEARETQWK
jgi:hypothetical protein